ncbi:MAG: indole-3-glycerol phosphate synthase TrpC [Anaerolineae bacterium]
MILDDIVARRRESIDAQRRLVPEAALRRQAEGCERRPLDFAAALRRPHVAVIAEVKRRSPSAGAIREDLSVAATCAAYAAGGAAAVSVLTEPDYFGGSFDDLAAARSTLTGADSRPILCKDFVVTEYQVYLARVAGADAVLLIAACLEPARLAALMAVVRGLGMTPLVEVHDAGELEAVLPLAPAAIGINNRDLRTFRTDLATTESLAPLAAGTAVVVSESGISNVDDVRRVAAAGAAAVLVGEALVRSGAAAAATLATLAAVLR